MQNENETHGKSAQNVYGADLFSVQWFAAESTGTVTIDRPAQSVHNRTQTKDRSMQDPSGSNINDAANQTQGQNRSASSVQRSSARA